MSDHIKEAMNAHTNLTVFSAVQALLENGLIYGPEPAAVRKIIAICKAEQQRQLRIMDAAKAKAEKGGA
jgi:hypothetical protein